MNDTNILSALLGMGIVELNTDAELQEFLKDFLDAKVEDLGDVYKKKVEETLNEMPEEYKKKTLREIILEECNFHDD